MIKKKNIILCLLLVSFTILSNLNYYKNALNIIINSNEYKSLVKNKKKYNISNELVLFSKMASLFNKELSLLSISLSEEQVIFDSDKDNIINDEFSLLNVKNCSKVQIYFSEIKNNIFFAEIIKTKYKVKYNNRPQFGKSYIYMFKIEDSTKVKLISTKEIFYN